MNFNQQRYHIFCYVVMNDHVHVLFRSNHQISLASILHSWKSYTANRLQREFQRKGSVWQDEYYDRIIQTEQEFYDTARYILNNARKRWGVDEYEWQYFASPEENGGQGRPPHK